MLSAFLNAFRTPDLRKKILFTLGILTVFRLGSSIPTPNVDTARSGPAQAATTGQQAGMYSMINLFPGGGATAAVDLRAGHHALHHQLDHPQLLTVVIRGWRR